MNFSFDEGGDNHGIRDVIYSKDFGERIEKFATSIRKAEDKIRAKYQKLETKLHSDRDAEIQAMYTVYKKRLKVTISLPKEDTAPV